MFTVLVIKDNGKIETKKIEKTFDAIMKTLGIHSSSFYDIKQVVINEKEYQIYYNPFAGGMKGTHIVAMWHNTFFLGTILITKYDYNGNLISMKKCDIKSIKDNLVVHGNQQHYVEGIHHFSNFIILNIK